MCPVPGLGQSTLRGFEDMLALLLTPATLTKLLLFFRPVSLLWDGQVELEAL